MKLFAAMGSPHLKGNTATLLEQVLAGARSVGHETFRADVYPAQLKPCLGCLACKKPGATCVQRDEMHTLYPQVIAADVLLWASPMYWWNVTGPLKNFIDRLFALPAGSLTGKRLLLVMTTEATPEEDGRQGLELLLKEMCAYTGMIYEGTMTASSGDKPVREQPDVLDAAFARGACLI